MKHSRWLSLSARQWESSERRSFTETEERVALILRVREAEEMFQTLSATKQTWTMSKHTASSLPHVRHRCCKNGLKISLFFLQLLCAPSRLLCPVSQSRPGGSIPIPTLRPDTLLRKPSALCCLSTRAGLHGLLMPAQSREGMAHGKDTPAAHTV